MRAMLLLTTALAAPPAAPPPPSPLPPPPPPATPGGGEISQPLVPAEWADRVAWENQNGRKMTNWHTKLHEHLIGKYSGYDLNAPPVSDRSKYADRDAPNTTFSFAAQTSDAGTDVQLQLRVLKLDQIDIASGSMAVKVWIRMQWQDDRLKWDPTKCEPRHKPTTL